ncbi:MAG TPA: TonB-dependent receptor, partial [Phaeodactylibacter sp.]|nr:TonB-dependent receptor [Phaeodactylibacter sp.]
MSALSFQKIIAANIILLLTTFFFPIRLHAQEVPTQVIRGTVVDAFTKTPIEGASLVLRGGQSMKSCRSDSLGRFRLEEVVVGRYTLDLSHLAYVSLEVPELLVESGKELILELLLEEKAANLQEVVVAGQRWRGSPLSTVSTQRITVEEVQRLPATFDDPARLIGSYAGVVNVHDGANHISVRGNSPNSTAWRLEGGEIVNPNHLADAGTSGNRPAATGGGVNLLSAQMLDYATLYSGAFPADYGNALGGIMDMYFRQGNDEKHFFTM